MNQEPIKKTQTTDRLRRAPLLGILGAFLLVSAVCVLGLLNDLSNSSKLVLSSEVANLQSHIERTIVRIETDLKDGKSLDFFSEPNLASWLGDHWKRMISSQPNRLYACIEDNSGTVRSSGGRFDLRKSAFKSAENIEGFPSYVRRIIYTNEVSPEVIEAIEVALPINQGEVRVGTYRTAIPATWLESKMAEVAWTRWLVWIVILIAMTAIVATTALFLFKLGAHTSSLEQALKISEARRLADLSKLVVSMAHELRNPLNSVRLNLFTSEKLIRGDSPMNQEEALVMIHESVSEIERVNELIGQLLGLVRADDSQDTWLNLDHEIQSLLQFMKPTHEYHQIQIDYASRHSGAIGKISKKYLRQILINLLQNARQAMQNGGTIRLEVNSDPQSEPPSVTVSVEDSGPGVPANLFEKIFEPFYSTHQDGAGLGLAVVKNLLEVSGGSVTCQRSIRLGGLKFTLRFQAKPESILQDARSVQAPTF